MHMWSSELSPSGRLKSLCLIPVSAMEGQKEYRLSVRIELGSNTTQPFAGYLTLGTSTKSSQTRVPLSPGDVDQCFLILPETSFVCRAWGSAFLKSSPPFTARATSQVFSCLACAQKDTVFPRPWPLLCRQWVLNKCLPSKRRLPVEC